MLWHGFSHSVLGPKREVETLADRPRSNFVRRTAWCLRVQHDINDTNGLVDIFEPHKLCRYKSTKPSPDTHLPVSCSSSKIILTRTLLNCNGESYHPPAQDKKKRGKITHTTPNALSRSHRPYTRRTHTNFNTVGTDTCQSTPPPPLKQREVA